MKRILLLSVLLFALSLTACHAEPTETYEIMPTAATPPEMIPNPTDTEPMAREDTIPTEITSEDTNMLKLTIGDHVIFAELESNETAEELKELLQAGPFTMSASNYGGFEKVCSLGTKLTSNDTEITTQPGDIMLYNRRQIVIFHGTNTWAYTRLGRVVEEDISALREVLTGNEAEATVELAG